MVCAFVKFSATIFSICILIVSVEGVSLSRLVDGWPTDSLAVPPEDLYDCIYLFFVCTEKASGSWPENKGRCTKMFEACQGKLGISPVDPDPDNTLNTITEVPETDGDEATSAPEGEGTPEQTTSANEEETATNNPDNSPTVAEEEDSGIVTLPTDLIVQSCHDVLSNGSKSTGVYSLQIGLVKKEAFCDMQTIGGGWTVIQRRGIFPPSPNPPNFFLKNWTDYQNGFGAANNELWLGLDSMFLLTNKEPVQLLITMDDWEGNRVGLFVNDFRIANEKAAYRIFYSSFSSDLGKSLPARGTKFSTLDRDNDAWSKNCAERFSGAWWYSACHNSNLNGLYLRGEHESFGDGVNWYHWKGYNYSLKNTVLKIRPQRLALTTSSTTTTTTSAPS